MAFEMTTVNETPKKIPWGGECCVLCWTNFSVTKEKINIFGKSALDISSLILRATKVDLSIYVEHEKLAICRTKCYNRLTRYKNAVRKVVEIEEEIKREFDGDISLRVTRLAKDQSSAPEAKKSLSFGDARSSVLRSTPTPKLKTPSKIAPCAIESSIISPIALEVFSHSLILSPAPQNFVKQAFGSFSGDRMYTSTPLRNYKEETQMQHRIELSLPESGDKETKVHLTVEYASKTIRKELKDDYAVLGKAVVHGSPQRIARAVLKNEKLKKFIIEKVLQLMALQVNGLCSRKHPSLLRAATKEGLAEFDLKKLCFEWKERAPIFYAFLMTCASSKGNNNPEWFPSVSVAGSILLKQRNSHMSCCASIMGIMLKSSSLEAHVCRVLIA